MSNCSDTKVDQLSLVMETLKELGDQIQEIRGHLGLTPELPSSTKENGFKVLHIDRLQEVVDQTATFTLHEPMIQVRRQLEKELCSEQDAVLLKALAYRDDKANLLFSLQSTTHLPYIEKFSEEQLAEACTPLVSPERWKILRVLMKSPMSPKGLMDVTGLSTGQFYHHLNLLLEHHFVTRIEGTYYITKGGIAVALWVAFAVTPLIGQTSGGTPCGRDPKKRRSK